MSAIASSIQGMSRTKDIWNLSLIWRLGTWRSTGPQQHCNGPVKLALGLTIICRGGVDGVLHRLYSSCHYTLHKFCIRDVSCATRQPSLHVAMQWPSIRRSPRRMLDTALLQGRLDEVLFLLKEGHCHL